MTGPVGKRLSARTDRYQQWLALTTNRRTRQRLRTFLVQGVQPISVAVACDWPIETLLHREGRLSPWAQEILDGPSTAARVELPADLLGELGGRVDGPPELLAVASIPPDDLARVPADFDLVLVGDRTASPGNLGTMVRTADALGASAFLVVGHAADPYDPQAVRASRGSLFAVPVVRVDSAAAILTWLRSRPGSVQVVGTSEDATTAVWDHDWRAPSVVVVGNETTGMSRTWTDACDALVAIPQTGAATSLNAAVSAAIILYEVRRQRSARADGAL